MLLSTSAHAGPYWFKDREPAKNVTVIYADKVDCGGIDALGCYMGYGDFGVIIVKAGLSAWIAACVLKHERHHADGFDHVSGAQPFIDCGDGNWASVTTMEGMR